jgi:hypothetical protein
MESKELSKIRSFSIENDRWADPWMKLHAGEIGRADGRELIIRL